MSQPDEFTRSNRSRFEQHTLYCPHCEVERTVDVRRDDCPLCLEPMVRVP